MSRLPDFTAYGEQPTPVASGGVASYEPADFSRAGNGIISAGRDLQEAAGLVAQTNSQQDKMVAESAFNRLQSQRIELEAGQGGFQRVKGGGAVGAEFVDGYQQKFTSAAKDIEQGLSNENQRRMFQQRMPVANLQFRSALLHHQASETDKFNDLTENDTVELARRSIFQSPTDPGAMQAGFAQIDWAIDQKAKRLGWDESARTETKRKFHEKVYEDAAAILVERDPPAALAAMNKRLGVGQDAQNSGVAAFDAINPNDLIKLHTRARSYVEQADNKARAEQEKHLKEAEHATDELQKFALTGQMVSPLYEQQVVASVAGTPFEPVAKQLIAASYAGATHGTQPIPKQEARLREYDVMLAQDGSSPHQLALIGHAREITNTQKEAYKETPWAAASRFGKQPEAPEQPISAAGAVPQLIAKRLPLMTGVETYAGHAVSPLQPNEAKDFADKLKALPPDQRAEVLGQTGAQLSVERANALADQLDKHDKPLALALKMGLDRTTASRAASTYVLRGAQALADKTVKKDDSALAGWRADIANQVRGTLGDDKAEQDVIDAAYYARAGLEQEGSAAVGFKSMRANSENAIAMVIGQPVTRNGVKTILPRGMKEGDFDTKLSAYTADKLREMAPSGEVFVRGQPVKVEQIASRLSGYGLRRDGKGRYVPVVNNAPITLDAQGSNLLRLEVR